MCILWSCHKSLLEWSSVFLVWLFYSTVSTHPQEVLLVFCQDSCKFLVNSCGLATRVLRSTPQFFWFGHKIKYFSASPSPRQECLLFLWQDQVSCDFLWSLIESCGVLLSSIGLAITSIITQHPPPTRSYYGIVARFLLVSIDFLRFMLSTSQFFWSSHNIKYSSASPPPQEVLLVLWQDSCESHGE